MLATHEALFDAIESALIAIEFGHITDDAEVQAAAEADLRTTTAEALGRGYILDAINCEVGDQVCNLHGDTGVIVSLRPCHLNPQIAVRWDAPSPHPNVFGAADLTTGSLRHRR